MAEQSQVERTYLEIKQRIIEGQYRPAIHLSETMLARIHKSSRTPVREALSRLLQEGYVEFTPKRGYAAAPITMSTVQNIFQVRRLLEGAAAEQAATTAGPDDVERLESVADSGYRRDERATYLAALSANHQFHMTVAETSRNAFLVDLVSQCLSKMDRVLSLGVDYGPFRDKAATEHRRIIDAIAKRRPAIAKREMERHVDHSHDLLMQALIRGDARGVRV